MSGISDLWYKINCKELNQKGESIMEERDKNIAAAALLLVAGGIIGAGVALLFAPQSGERTRKDLVRYAKKAKRRADDAVDDISATVGELVEQFEEKAKDVVKTGLDSGGKTRKDLIQLIEEGASKLERLRTLLRRA